MANSEKIYEVMGELLFAVAKADGVIQSEEKEAMQALLKDHPWAQDVQWSFAYEADRGSSVEEVYQKVITFCKMNGPAPEYQEFIFAMEKIAEAADGVSDGESKIMKSFSGDLLAQFRKDVEGLE